MGFYRWFFSGFIWEPPPTPNRERFCICDDMGTLPVPEDYVRQGVKEGWLIRESWHRDSFDVLWHTYRLAGTKRD